MGFNEMTHAFLAARYYIRLTEQFGDRGWEAFIHGIQYYGSQRGRRMAQRAIRDGKPLRTTAGTASGSIQRRSRPWEPQTGWRSAAMIPIIS